MVKSDESYEMIFMFIKGAERMEKSHGSTSIKTRVA